LFGLRLIAAVLAAASSATITRGSATVSATTAVFAAAIISAATALARAPRTFSRRRARSNPVAVREVRIQRRIRN
jgi:hypothetical protein